MKAGTRSVTKDDPMAHRTYQTSLDQTPLVTQVAHPRETGRVGAVSLCASLSRNFQASGFLVEWLTSTCIRWHLFGSLPKPFRGFNRRFCRSPCTKAPASQADIPKNREKAPNDFSNLKPCLPFPYLRALSPVFAGHRLADIFIEEFIPPIGPPMPPFIPPFMPP